MEYISKSFNKLGLNDKLLFILKKIGYKNPFKIQEICIPEILNNFDILGISNTGSGKTAAFVLPILNKLKNIKNTQFLILEPTRELAIQVNKVILSFTKYIKWINVIILYGGQKIDIQLNCLKLIRHIIIGTPGRLLDHLNKNTINLSKLSGLIIDEADEMFKMGFIDDIKKIISYTPSNKQTLLFSATMPLNLKKIAYSFMNNNYKEFFLNKDVISIPKINQYYYLTNNISDKKNILIKFLTSITFNSIIIFVNTKNKTIEIYNFLKKFNFKSFYLNGDMKQSLRENTIKLFRNNKLSILIATDVASRGLDISKINWVINFDCPLNEEIYIHRIGRTGRAGNIGNSLLLLNNKELILFKKSKNKNINLKSINNLNLKLNSIEELKLNDLIIHVKKNITNDELNKKIYSTHINKLLYFTNNDLNKLLKIFLYLIYKNNL